LITNPQLAVLTREIIECNLCKRLRKHCQEVARVKRRAYLDQTYLGRPVPPFGDPNARLLIVGLAPGAHGANRTGRVFTGDKSGDFLYRALYETGFANQPNSVSPDDGLQLTDCWITASVRCAPPDNKPSPEEFRRCQPFLEREMAALPNVRIVVALGKLAFDTYLAVAGVEKKSVYKFGHGLLYPRTAGSVGLLASYHPSQQNTSTKKLTAAMLREVFELARKNL
jgi:uracil-DNA glycosylase